MSKFYGFCLAILLGPSCLGGCVEVPVAQDAPVGNGVAPSITVDRKIDEKLTLSGNTIYIYPISHGLSQVMNEAHQAELVRILKAYLRKQGFQIAQKYSKGFSTLYLSGDQYKAVAKIDSETQQFLKEACYNLLSQNDKVYASK